MKNLFLVVTILFSIAASAQIIVFQPVEVPPDMTEKFLDVELNYSKKIAQDAVNKGELEGWALLQNTNATARQLQLHLGECLQGYCNSSK